MLYGLVRCVELVVCVSLLQLRNLRTDLFCRQCGDVTAAPLNFPHQTDLLLVGETLLAYNIVVSLYNVCVLNACGSV